MQNHERFADLTPERPAPKDTCLREARLRHRSPVIWHTHFDQAFSLEGFSAGDVATSRRITFGADEEIVELDFEDVKADCDRDLKITIDTE